MLRAAGGLGLIMTALALAAVSGASPETADVKMTSGDAGALTITNSKEGTAVLTAGNMRPGDSASGTVTIENSGTVAGEFELAKSNLTDASGIGGGTLSTNLDLAVVDVTDAGSPVGIYSGKLDEMGSLDLGTFAPGAAHTYSFTATFPDGGTPASAMSGDNAYQGASMSVQYDWTATANDDADTVAPETTIDAAPTDPSGDPSPSFGFSSSESGSTFECKLDTGAFERCTSPKGYAGLADGTHTFDVRATDAAGNVDTTPATHAWTISTTPVFAQLAFNVTGPSRLAWSKRSPIVLRVQLSRTSAVRIRLYNPSGARIYTWNSTLGAGTRYVKLRVLKVIKRPGYHTIRARATTGDSTKRVALRVRILAPVSASTTGYTGAGSGESGWTSGGSGWTAAETAPIAAVTGHEAGAPVAPSGGHPRIAAAEQPSAATQPHASSVPNPTATENDDRTAGPRSERGRATAPVTNPSPTAPKAPVAPAASASSDTRGTIGRILLAIVALAALAELARTLYPRFTVRR